MYVNVHVSSPRVAFVIECLCATVCEIVLHWLTILLNFILCILQW